MTFVGFLRFAVKCFNVLAWPLCSLGYPLCASIRAIESNSNTDIQNLVTYWISFSLISLFDHAFAKLLHWNPFWPYMKLLAIFWLVMPHFDSSLYVYKHFVHPCVSVTPELVMNRFSAWKEFFFLKENFLVAAERYIEENGAEALQKLIANKTKCAKPKSDVKKVKAIDTNEKNAESPECKEPIVAQTEIKKVEATKNREADAAKWVDKPEVNLFHTENKAYAAAEIKGETAAVSIAVKENKLPEMPSIKTVQNEWTCALCQVTTSNETVLNSHLQGRKHKTKCAELKAKEETAKNKGSLASMTTNSNRPKVEPKKFVPVFRNKDAGRTTQFNAITHMRNVLQGGAVPTLINFDAQNLNQGHTDWHAQQMWWQGSGNPFAWDQGGTYGQGSGHAHGYDQRSAWDQGSGWC